MRDLGALTAKGDSEACAINNFGLIVGDADSADGRASHAFLLQGGKMEDLGTLGGIHSHAYGVNDAGQVVGYSSLQGNRVVRAFLWHGGAMLDLGMLPGFAESEARAINSAGLVVGTVKTNTADIIRTRRPATTRAFLWSAGEGMTELGTLPGGTNSDASGVNDLGQIVGAASTAKERPYHAFLYEKGRMYDLNDLIPQGGGWELITANAINDKGQIAGYGYFSGGAAAGHPRAFLLKPAGEAP